MYKLSRDKFIRDLEKAKTEDEVRYAYAKAYDINFDSSDKHDLYTPQILFEFKYDKNFENAKIKATILAQALYYIRRLKFGITDKSIPPVICLADVNEAAFTGTNNWKEFYTDTAEKYDWDLAASSPDAKLIADIYATEALRNIHIYKIQLEHEYQNFSEKILHYLNPQTKLDFGDKKIITEDNFEEVYKYWEHLFGESVRNGQKPSKYFVADIQEGRTIVQKENGKVLFRIGVNEWRDKKILAKDYEYFWNLYEKVTNPFIIRGIISKVDRLTDEYLRRFHGEFFTPLPFAKKGLEYIEKTIGKSWWKQGYKLWDMAAGTGNLQYYLPAEAWQHCYLSTYDKEDVGHLQKLFADATSFQYDYLNDDIEYLFADGQLPFELNWKLPQKLRDDLQNKNNKWIILINPPFATSQTAGTTGKSKQDVSNTAIRSIMHTENLGEVSRELFSQFLFRIKKEFSKKVAHLTLFSTLKYVNATNDQKLRDNLFTFSFERGFMFSSANFSGTKKNNAFPVGVLIWDLSNKKHIQEQDISLDVFDTTVEKIAFKKIITEHKEKFLSKWIDRPDATINFPPFKSAISIAVDSNKDVRDRISENFIGSLMCKGNDIQNQNFTALLSGPYVSAGALSITPANFEQSMVVHAVRRVPKANWINDRDQFMQPNCELPKEFITDCVVWNLFSSSNQTVAMKDVQYNGKTFQVHNHFFPFLISEIKNWKISDSEIAITLTGNDERFVATWLQNQTEFSDKALPILAKAKEIYEYYFTNLHQLRTPKYKIQTWDAGWWQIRNAIADENLADNMLADLKFLHNNLKEKLVKQVYEFGFLG